MDRLNKLLSNELESGKASGKIQKIIFDIIFQYIQDMVYVMKMEKGPSFSYLFVNEAGMRNPIGRRYRVNYFDWLLGY